MEAEEIEFLVKVHKNLKELKEAFNSLSEKWENNEDDTMDQLLTDRYPFAESFSDLNLKVRLWAGYAMAKIKDKLQS